jgi:hypothetical protein
MQQRGRHEHSIGVTIISAVSSEYPITLRTCRPNGRPAGHGLALGGRFDHVSTQFAVCSWQEWLLSTVNCQLSTNPR